MARGRFFSNQDIDIYLSRKEFIKIGLIEIKDEKIVHPSIEVALEREEGSSLKAVVQKQDFDNLGDGIEVTAADSGFSVRINEKVYWRVLDHSGFGTRYDGFGSKINFYIEP